MTMVEDAANYHGDIPLPAAQVHAVAPATAGETNRLRAPLRPVASVRFDDTVFHRGTSALTLASMQTFATLGEYLRRWGGALLSLFAHDDRSSKDDAYVLGARRAKAVRAVLLSDTAAWLEAARNPVFTDHWADVRVSEYMMDALYAHDFPLPRETPTPTSPAFAGLANTYLHLLRDGDGRMPPLEALPPGRFLSSGDGRAGAQCCAASNPLLILERGRHAAAAELPSLLHASGPNRRVMVYLFPVGSRVSADRWPCPGLEESNSVCRQRRWSDADQREEPAETIRRHEHAEATFACRFYERLTERSPAELAGPLRPEFKVASFLRSNSGAAPIANAPFQITLPGSMVITGKTDAEGRLQVMHVPSGEHPVTIDGYEVILPTVHESQAESIVRIDGYAIDVGKIDEKSK